MTEITVENDKVLVGCGLCAHGAQWIANRDIVKLFQLVPIASVIGPALFRSHAVDPRNPTSRHYLQDGKDLTGLKGWARIGHVIGRLPPAGSGTRQEIGSMTGLDEDFRRFHAEGTGLASRPDDFQRRAGAYYQRYLHGELLLPLSWLAASVLERKET